MHDMRRFEGVGAALYDNAGVLGSWRIYERELESIRAVLELLAWLYASWRKLSILPDIHRMHVSDPVDRKMSLADGETETVANGVTNPFETSLIDEMNGAKAGLER